MRPKKLRLGAKQRMQLGQPKERHTRKEVMLEVIVHVLRREENPLQERRQGRPSARVGSRLPLKGRVLGDASDAENEHETSEQRDQPVQENQTSRPAPEG